MRELFEDQPIKVISIWQPWASLIAAGLKIDETRHWATAYRGPIAIHAAKTIDTVGAPEALCRAAFGPHWARLLPIGMVVALGKLTACSKAENVAPRTTAANRAAGNFAAGRFAWRIENVQPLQRMLPLTGRQGLFNWTPPADLDERLGATLNHAASCRYIGWGAVADQVAS